MPDGGFAGPPVRTVLFDYGNTLTTFRRPQGALEEAYGRIRQTLLSLGQSPPSVETLLRDVHDRVEREFEAHCRSGAPEEIDLVAAAIRAYADLGIDITAEQLDALFRVEQRAWWQGVTPVPDAVPTLDALRASGIRVGLCSNAPYHSLREQLEHLGLAAHLDAVAFSADTGWRKPDARMFRAALAALDADVAHTVMVGDTERDDIQGARAMGMRTVLYRPEGVADTSADAVVTRLADLVPLFVEKPASILDSRS